MAVKFFDVENIGIVRVSKRSGTRNLRLTITPNGEIRVSIPNWSRYQHGVDFAVSKIDWILQNTPAKQKTLEAGHRVGKAHRFVFSSAAIDVPSSRLIGSEIRIARPIGMATSHPEVQKVAKRASIRALRSEAEALLPQRLRTLANKYDFTYNSVSIKQLKGRWGSCDTKQQIVLNLYLMQLPWELIDYVLLHELIHTKHMNHGDDFWQEFLIHDPAAKKLRKAIKVHKPILEPVVPLIS